MPFFTFGTSMSSRAARVSFAGIYGADDGVNPNPIKLVTGDYGSIEFPIRFEQLTGKNFGDVLDTRSAVLFLISDRVKQALDEEGLTGWCTFEVSVSDRSGNPVFGYNGFSVTGRSGPIDLEQSKVIQKRLVPDGPLSNYYKGKFVRQEEWDGSDFFLPQHHYGIMVSPRAATVLNQRSFTNLLLRDAREIEIDEYTADLIRSKY